VGYDRQELCADSPRDGSELRCKSPVMYRAVSCVLRVNGDPTLQARCGLSNTTTRREIVSKNVRSLADSGVMLRSMIRGPTVRAALVNRNYWHKSWQKGGESTFLTEKQTDAESSAFARKSCRMIK
jgi:hypothetical protein